MVYTRASVMECYVHVFLINYMYVSFLTRDCIIPHTQDGPIPLYVASWNGHSDVVNILIRNGADVNLAWQVYNDDNGVVLQTHFLCMYLLHIYNRDGSLLTLPDLRDTLTLFICWKEWDISVCPGH